VKNVSFFIQFDIFKHFLRLYCFLVIIAFELIHPIELHGEEIAFIHSSLLLVAGATISSR
tara:strand:+ start:150 stop:329 length:180 start_codon:yes stop_codon:yes gene_type:complete